VEGTVREARSFQLVAGARVTVFVPSLGFFREARTDVRGRFTIQPVPDGSYRLGVAARDFEYQERDVTLSGSAVATDFFLTPETHRGNWSVIGNTLPEFFDATDIAILQQDGKVFLCHNTKSPILFDPVTGTKQFAPSSYSEQGCTSAALLGDGRTVFVGGQSPSDPGSFGNAVPWVKARTPSGSWQALPDLKLTLGRWYPGLARLSDGSMLVMGGGMAPNAQRTDTCERFSLASSAWSWTGNMLNPTEFPPSALLHTGKVLATWWPPQLYDPGSGAWQAAGNFVQPSRGWPGHSDHSLVVLSDGRALAMGIRKSAPGNQWMGEIYDPSTNSWSVTANPGLVRQQPEVVQLPDGRVLVAAGETEAPIPPVPDVLGIVRWCDLFDPAKNAWRRVADMGIFREYHAVTLLIPDGRVITTGGTHIKFQVGPTSADIEAFEPPCLSRGVRPQITSISSAEPKRGETISLGVFPETRLTSVVLMGMAAPTHWVDGGVPRRIELPVSQAASMAQATLPADPNILPLGYYLVFAMVDDIPSVARIVNVKAAG
jgi:galactose oxidase-like protein/carboxypeptidase family protein